MRLLIGAIADDFTGATDLSNTLSREGMSVIQAIGVPGPNANFDPADAVVIALKSRTVPASEAVSQSLAALDWLRTSGARQIVFKYCSTFDSTPKGNIGPVADALLGALGSEFAVVCPAFPANGRTVYKGTLFVGDLPLAESSMKDHPLTPMRDSNLLRLMEAQSASRAGLIPIEIVRAGSEAISARIRSLGNEGVTYGVADALADDDLRMIGRAVADHALVTGGSGIALGLTERFRVGGKLCATVPIDPQAATGRSLVLAGSCSTATRKQIAHAKKSWPCRKLDIDGLACGGRETQSAIDCAIDWALAQSAKTPILLYGSADRDEVACAQERYGIGRAGRLVEDALAAVARRLRNEGFGRIIVAGGETSGAVVSALGVTALRIGPQIAHGVPWTESVGSAPIALALKSGNFGSETFFEEAFRMLP